MERILITPLVGMGDMLMITPALRLLKQRHPEHHVTCVAMNRGSFEILQRNPDIDHLEYFPFTAAGFVRGVTHILRRYAFRYSVSINFYPSNRAAYNLFSLLSMCPKRIGHRYLHCDVSQLNWLKNLTVREDPRAHCVEENVRLLRYLDPAFAGTFTADTIPAMRLCLTEEERARGKVFRQSLGAATAVGIHAGTSVFKGHARRRWPKEKFVRLVDSLPGVAFVLFGTAEEAVANEYIVSHAAYPAKVTLVNSAPVREVAAMIGELDAFVTNDSGLMHIAAAMETPIVALLGPTNPAYIRPWKAACEVLRTGIACSPCFYYSPRPLRCSLNGTFQCMADLGVEAAHDALQRLCSVSPRRSVP